MIEQFVSAAMRSAPREINGFKRESYSGQVKQEPLVVFYYTCIKDPKGEHFAAHVWAKRDELAKADDVRALAREKTERVFEQVRASDFFTERRDD